MTLNVHIGTGVLKTIVSGDKEKVVHALFTQTGELTDFSKLCKH